MLVGPVFTREFVAAPRRVRFYLAPAVYVAMLLMLSATAWMLLTGTQHVRNIGDVARFGGALFQFLAPLQFVLAVFFSALASASAVAQEKDRRTLILLLLTNLTNSELVLGKLFASLLNILVVLTAALPFFMFTAMFGGVSFEQIFRVFFVTLISAVAAGSLGSTIALWREKTFQILALTALVFGLLAGWEVAVASGVFQGTFLGEPLSRWAAGLSPWQAVMAAMRPRASLGDSLPIVGSTFNLYALACVTFAVVVNVIAIARVRIWNPSRETQPRTEEVDEFRTADASAPAPARSVHAIARPTRRVWDNPIIWREICTRAYGHKVLIVRLAYVALSIAAVLGIHQSLQAGTGASIAPAVVGLFVLSLVLLNALAVTSITTERDLGALDLLLVTDITPSEFIYGKLGGVFYVAKEMLLLPAALCIYMWWAGAITPEHVAYLIGGLAVMYVFVATLGIHVGLAYTNSRTAVGVSLGTVFFLFIGIAAVMRIMISFSGSFQMQLAPFLAVMIGGSTGLFVALGTRNPSQAIGLASLLLPALTFVAITGYLQGDTLSVFLIVALTYGLTTAAMLVPAISEFDIATGRTTE